MHHNQRPATDKTTKCQHHMNIINKCKQHTPQPHTSNNYHNQMPTIHISTNCKHPMLQTNARNKLFYQALSSIPWVAQCWWHPGLFHQAWRNTSWWNKARLNTLTTTTTCKQQLPQTNASQARQITELPENIQVNLLTILLVSFWLRNNVFWSFGKMWKNSNTDTCK